MRRLIGFCDTNFRADKRPIEIDHATSKPAQGDCIDQIVVKGLFLTEEVKVGLGKGTLGHKN